MTVVSSRVIERLPPWTVSIWSKATTSVELYAPATTWYRRTSVRAAGLARSQFRTSGSTAANASSVGAKTVNGPVPSKALTRSAASKAASRVVNEPA